MITLFNFVFGATLVTDPQQAIDPTKGLSDMPTFIQGVFPTMVKVIAALAILAIAYWGIKYTLSNVAGIKGVSKEQIWNALLGLLLALSAYFILNIINPNIIGSLNNFVTGQ